MSKSLEEHAGPIPEAWEGEERSYIFECRLGRAQQLKDLGNQHFKRSEWVPALARYKKALYHAHFDQLQSWDLMDHHKEMQVCADVAEEPKDHAAESEARE